MSEERPDTRVRSLVGLVVVVALLSGVWCVMTALRRSAALENCYASGRRDCVTIDGNGAHVNR